MIINAEVLQAWVLYNKPWQQMQKGLLANIRFVTALNIRFLS